MAKNLVVKDNALINASYNLELVEQRLILLAIVEARASGKGISPNNSLTITASSYMNHFNTNRNASYKALKEACNNLFERQFSFIEKTEKGDKVVRTRWVSQVGYLENEAMVELIFSPAVAPLITLLEKNFTSYELEQVSELNSKYAVRLYEIVIAWRSTSKTPMIAIDELRDRLGVLDDEYQITGDFKKRVLDYALKQINDKTDITITYEQHKNGRKIIGFTFTIKQKQKQVAKTKDSERDPKTVDMFSGFTDIERHTIQKRIDEHIKRLEQKGEIVGDFHRKNIEQKAISERWGLDVLAEKERKKTEKQTKARQDKERLELAKQQFEQILSDDRLINAYIAHNLNPKYLNGLQKSYYEQGNFRGVVEMEKYKFEELHHLKYVNLEFLK
ncbi:replication initiation protein RepM [Pasteurella multocida]|nr:replication initiation protein RepM [Pasteurella multocida]MDY0660979.1 replication initiation protein RepM [Pasteurella multocida]MDY0689092.1 replication initiation protein RepM [Pasteurella multocida]